MTLDPLDSILAGNLREIERDLQRENVKEGEFQSGREIKKNERGRETENETEKARQGLLTNKGECDAKGLGGNCKQLRGTEWKILRTPVDLRSVSNM